jgi:short-subunit dehydrogenase
MAASYQRALVVGASSGIGESIARQLSAQGATVALVARRQAELDRVAGDIRKAGGRAEVFAHDVVNFDATPALFDRIVEQLGGLDLVVYASGVLHDIAENEWNFAKDRETIEVNVIGAMAWLNPAGAHFQAQGSGTILGISSVAGERGRRGNAAYGTSKAALTAYLESLRNRLTRYGVRVVTIKPGFIDTPMTKGKQGMFWLISADEAARRSLAIASRGGQSGFVPARWGLVALILKLIPSFVFRRLNF